MADSALPIGRFAHSGGLEAFLAQETGAGEETIAELVESALLESLGPLDGVALAHAHDAAARGDVEALLRLDRRLTACKLPAPARLASSTCGRRLAALVGRLTDGEPACTFARQVARGETDGNLAVVEGALAPALGIGRDEAVVLELRGAAFGLLSAAVRLGRLSAIAAQGILRHLEPAILAAAALAAELPLEAMRSSTPELEIYALAHARQPTRLFAT